MAKGDGGAWVGAAPSAAVAARATALVAEQTAAPWPPHDAHLGVAGLRRLAAPATAAAGAGLRVLPGGHRGCGRGSLRLRAAMAKGDGGAWVGAAPTAAVASQTTALVAEQPAAPWPPHDAHLGVAGLRRLAAPATAAAGAGLRVLPGGHRGCGRGSLRLRAAMARGDGGRGWAQRLLPQ